MIVSVDMKTTTEAEALIERRRAQGVTIEKIAEILGVRVGTVYRWKRTGKMNPFYAKAVLEKLA